jgi:diguanylate cyclase (GGDEF)-like protein
VAALRRLAHGRWWARLFVSVAALSLVAGSALALHDSQNKDRHGVNERYAARTKLASDFVGTYVRNLTTRERAVALSTLTGKHPSTLFASDVRAFGFQAADLLDGQGRVLSISPAEASLTGLQLGTSYPNLTTALRGQVAVSDVVTSALQGPPVVAFAVPFPTTFGRRVFSGAYRISDTPLAAFLRDTTTLKNAHIYLTDSDGSVLASNGAALQAVRTLTQRDPALGHATATARGGQYQSGSTSFTFAREAVSGTPWSLVISARSSEVFVAVDGSTHWLPWLILVALSLLIGLAGFLAVRLLEGRRRLRDANARLAAVARTDSLTGLFNRLHITEQLEGLMANAGRHSFPLCVLMIDIDHFKQLNDSYGHQAGDLAIRHIAERLTTSLRDGDLLGRWGGEEFLAVLPYTALAEGIEVADRIRRLLAATPVAIDGKSDPITIRTSIGVAEAGDDSLAALVHRADLGLYEAKSAGRNTVRAIVGDLVVEQHQLA